MSQKQNYATLPSKGVATESKVESLAREVYAQMLRQGPGTSILTHHAELAIQAATAFYEVWDANPLRG